MITIGNLKVYWKHTMDRKPFLLEGTKDVMIDGETECVIRDENNFVLAVGIAYKHVEDRFCREEGRRYSLPRALDYLTRDMSKEQGKQVRRNIWTKYLNRCS